MQKRYLFSFGFVIALLLAGYLLMNDTAETPATPAKETCCKKSSAVCTPSTPDEAAPATNLENLSHQFISLPVLFH